MVYCNALDWFRDTPGMIDWLYSYVGSTNINVAKSSLLLLTVLCEFLDDGYDVVTKAVSRVCENRNCPAYSDVINCLRAGDLHLVQSAVQFVVTLLQANETHREKLCKHLATQGLFEELLNLRETDDLIDLLMELQTTTEKAVGHLRFDNWALAGRVRQLERRLAERDAEMEGLKQLVQQSDIFKAELFRQTEAIREAFHSGQVYINSNCPMKRLLPELEKNLIKTEKERPQCAGEEKPAKRSAEHQGEQSTEAQTAVALPCPPQRFEIAKYEKMKKIGLPEQSIRNKIRQDGFDEGLYDVFISNKCSTAEIKETLATKPIQAPPGFDVAKYLKMKKIGMPEASIRNRMRQDGFSEELYSTHVLGLPAAAQPCREPPNGFDIAKYKKMRKVGMPEASIRNRIRQDGFDDSLFDVFVLGKPASASRRSKNSKPKGPQPTKPVIRPAKRMKNLHWKRIILDSTNKLHGVSNLWKDLDKERTARRLVDEKELVALFSERRASGRRSRSSLKAKRGLITHHLDKKRFNNLSILISALKPVKDIGRRILIMDQSLTCSQIAQIMHQGPSPDELKLLRGHDYGTLATPEKFLVLLGEIPQLRSRLRSWKYTRDFTETAVSVETSARAIRKAAEELRANEALRKCIALVLEVGNYLNGSTAKGRADGFGLELLSKLDSLRANDLSGNLLSYLAKVCKHNIPAAVHLPKTLSSVKVASGVCNGVELRSKCVALKKGFERLQKDIKNVKTSGSQDRFHQKMSLFVQQNSAQVVKLCKATDESLLALKKTMQYFTLQKPDLAGSREFFGMFCQFAMKLCASMPSEQVKVKRNCRRHKIGSKITNNSNNDAMALLIDAVKKRHATAI